MSRATTPRARALPFRAALGVLVAFVAFFASALRPPALPDVPRAVASIARLAEAPNGEITRAERPAVLRKVADVRQARADADGGRPHGVLDAGLGIRWSVGPCPRLAGEESRVAAVAARAKTPKRHDELMVFLN